ncbi:ATP-binding protein [Streptomyces sp. RFCAC02]|uniref:ATP-binding protein n=1 Tax=Streptomyces sp. RFCAC02 TaxID=2499143 RepID=UPI00101FE561|nr:ATP-binding protein [Streptomyces sp. RFCAC02]
MAAHGFTIVGRGLGQLARAGRARWARTPRERRWLPAAGAAVAVAAVLAAPYGAAAGAGLLLSAAYWAGRRAERAEQAAAAEAAARLGLLYEALVPYFSLPADPSPEPLYAPGGAWARCFRSYVLGDDGRLLRLRLLYPAFFPDGDADCRARVERVVAGKAGRDREVRFRWEEERNELEVVVLPDLPAGIGAQRFVAGPGETVLGFTDAWAVDRTVPVRGGAEYGERLQAAPVVWRWGPRSAEPHLLVVGAPGAGATSLLRSVALQALEQGGEVLLVDGGGGGEFACFAGRAGVLGVETTAAGAVTGLRWAQRETERRLLAAGRGERPLWLVVDRPALIGHLARVQGVGDPLALLDVPLRYGRGGRVTVVVAEQAEALERLGPPVAACARARVLLGAVDAATAAAVLGGPPPGGRSRGMPPGRGFARLGPGPVHRLQVPATPDPYDETADEAARRAVLALLPERRGPVPAGTTAAEDG